MEGAKKIGSKVAGQTPNTEGLDKGRRVHQRDRKQAAEGSLLTIRASLGSEQHDEAPSYLPGREEEAGRWCVVVLLCA